MEKWGRRNISVKKEKITDIFESSIEITFLAISVNQEPEKKCAPGIYSIRHIPC